MILTQRKIDNVDVVTLIGAMLAANVAEDRLPEGEIARISAPETGAFYPVTTAALRLIAEMHRQSEDDWDGVVWMERFENTNRGSLADTLVEFLIDHDPKVEEVRPVIVAWLQDRSL
jgi:hypothetical protein